MPVEDHHDPGWIKGPGTLGSRKKSAFCRGLAMASTGIPHSRSHHTLTLNPPSYPSPPRSSGGQPP